MKCPCKWCAGSHFEWKCPLNVKWSIISLIQNKFDELDPELLSRQVNKFAKYVSQLEKGLVPNNVVPCLKENVESMREKVGQVGTKCQCVIALQLSLCIVK